MPYANTLNDGINTFPIAHVRDQLITFTFGQLRDLISQAVKEAIQPLQERIEALEDRLDGQQAEMAVLRQTVASLEAMQEQDTTRLALDIAHDRQRLAKLEQPPEKEPGKIERSRAEKIEKYIQTKPDHRATFESLRGHLGVNKDRLKEAINVLMAAHPGRYVVVRSKGDKRKRILTMIPK